MAIRHTTINGSQKVWLARVAYQGRRRAKVCRTKEEARHAEGELLRDLKGEAARTEQEGARPATLRSLLEFYAADMHARGKGDESVERVEYTARVIRDLMPGLLDKPVSAITDADLFAFRNARLREGKVVHVTIAGEKQVKRVPNKPSTINRDLRTLRGALKKARPGYRFPGGAFFKEDETRVRWLRQAHTEASREADRAKATWPASEYVFPGPDGRPYSREQVGKMFRRASRAAGLKDFHFHDLRHHGATMALNKGFTAPIVMALGGWKTERMMRRYAAVTDQTLRAAAEAVSGHLPAYELVR